MYNILRIVLHHSGTLRGYFKDCIYVVLLFGCIWRNIVHMKFIWTIFFVNIQHIYPINIFSTFLWFHICVLLLDMNFSIMLADILFWSALGTLREDMVNLNTLRSCRYVHLYFFRVYDIVAFNIGKVKVFFIWSYDVLSSLLGLK